MLGTPAFENPAFGGQEDALPEIPSDVLKSILEHCADLSLEDDPRCIGALRAASRWVREVVRCHFARCARARDGMRQLGRKFKNRSRHQGSAIKISPAQNSELVRAFDVLNTRMSRLTPSRDISDHLMVFDDVAHLRAAIELGYTRGRASILVGLSQRPLTTTRSPIVDAAGAEEVVMKAIVDIYRGPIIQAFCAPGALPVYTTATVVEYCLVSDHVDRRCAVVFPLSYDKLGRRCIPKLGRIYHLCHFLFDGPWAPFLQKAEPW